MLNHIYRIMYDSRIQQSSTKEEQYGLLCNIISESTFDYYVLQINQKYEIALKDVKNSWIESCYIYMNNHLLQDYEIQWMSLRN